ncbi:serine/threonine-protein kinase N2-like [Xenopus laevis]|uniref:Serine/threonine-protein kinase N2-like n=1 Tax=Xenopus laevis TaxID=8355 RepID=A0A8J1LYC3_XENLA|nr:serine/threonine-protein kinase N2-like [Xenopus laevis]
MYCIVSHEALSLQVYKGQHRTSGKTVAIKTIEMHDINNRGVFHCVAQEQRILRLIDEEKCQFLTSLLCSFQTEDHLCLVMEYAEAGNLAAFTAQPGMPLERVRFYSACMVLGLQFLHEHNIAHRDLKPENILLYGDGYVKIADFGISELGMNFDTITNGECGTIFYKAPELFRGQYTRSVDWWALGVTIYELLTGIVPFNGTTTLEIYVIIKSEEPKYPEDITEDTLSILVNLLKKDAQLRLGTGEHGTEDVKKSPFFEGLDWVALENKEIQPPFIPERRPHEQPEAELELKTEVKAKLWEDTQWGLDDLKYPMGSSSDSET